MSTPKHIAIIMDGNGRWAKKRFLPRASGHQKGVQAVREIVKRCDYLGVETLTLFAFSSENKNRPNEEVSLLFKLFLNVLQQETSKLQKNNVRLKIIGDLSFFPEAVQQNAVKAEKLLSQNTGLTLVVAVNYGGRWDLVEATKKIAKLSKNGKIDPDLIDDKTLKNHLSMADLPDVDLLIRTSGEVRISNFLLWDIAYSELYFTDTLWPDFRAQELDRAIADFEGRQRRFGGRTGEANAD